MHISNSPDSIASSLIEEVFLHADKDVMAMQERAPRVTGVKLAKDVIETKISQEYEKSRGNENPRLEQLLRAKNILLELFDDDRLERNEMLSLLRDYRAYYEQEYAKKGVVTQEQMDSVRGAFDCVETVVQEVTF